MTAKSNTAEHRAALEAPGAGLLRSPLGALPLVLPKRRSWLIGVATFVVVFVLGSAGLYLFTPVLDATVHGTLTVRPVTCALPCSGSPGHNVLAIHEGSPTGRVIGYTKPDSQGHFTFQLRQGTYVLSSATAYVPCRVTLKAAILGQTTVNLACVQA